MKFSTVGKPVNFRKNSGVVEDDVSILEEYGDRDFLDLIQYIKWDDGGHSVRICYYVRNHGTKDEKWIFANRPLSISPTKFSRLLRKAVKKKWFKA
jgi:hypothetical protein